MANIVMTTHWTDGDVLPFVKIGKVLKSRGHKVTLLTHCYYENIANNAGLEFVAWETPEQFEQYEKDMKELLSVNQISSIKEFRENFSTMPESVKKFKDKYENLAIYKDEYDKIYKCCTANDTVLFAKNRSSVSALLTSEKHKIPLISVLMAPSETISMRVNDTLFSKQLADDANSIRIEFDLPPVNNWYKWQSSPKINIALWPEWFYPPDDEWETEIKTVGFPLPEILDQEEIPKELQEIFNGPQKPLLISGGTSKVINPDFYSASAKACEVLGIPGILVTRHEELVPKKMPSNVKWFKYLPLNLIMPNVAAIIHHGGMGTLSGALRAGIPQLILAHLNDGPTNALRLQELGVAEYIPRVKWHPDTLANALVKIMSPNFKQHIEEFSKKMTYINPLIEVSKIIESVVGCKEYAVNPFENYNKPLNNKEEIMASLKLLSLEKRDVLLAKLKQKINS